MLVDIEFNEPFFGIIYPNGSRLSACFTHGSGAKKYHLELPLKGCGTSRVRLCPVFSSTNYKVKDFEVILIFLMKGIVTIFDSSSLPFQIERRVFLNNIIVRFHKELELEGDEVKTIICRYPSPEVLLPPIPAPIM